MIAFINKSKTTGLLLAAAVAFATSSCNKEPEQFPEPPAEIPTGQPLGRTLAASADDALFYKILARANKLTLLNDSTRTFTVFSPGNSAIKSFISAVTGGGVDPNSPDAVFEGFISTALSSGLADTLVSYHILPQKVVAADIPATFPNFPYPTLFNPASALSAFARLDAYTSRRDNGVWDNNIPVVAPDIMASNGVIHRIAAVAVPPSQLLLQRIASDTTLSFLMAAIIRADSGKTIATTGSLQYYFGSSAIALGANFTVFAPTNQAFRNTLYAFAYPIVFGQLYEGAFAQAIGAGADGATAKLMATAYADANAPAATIATAGTPAVFQNPALFSYFPAQTVQGIVANHVLLSRAFTVNLPTTATNVPTMLSAAIPHPGLAVAATFTGPAVTAGTVKGLGNATAANILINPFPGGSSDQHYVNGVLHKIDQVLLPQ